jgi:hypothetical protein
MNRENAVTPAERRVIIDPLEFPTTNDWKRISDASCLDELFMLLKKCRLVHSSDVATDWKAIRRVVEVRPLLYEVQQRLADVGRSYILMMFYYEKGIPDNPWWAERESGGVIFYPQFEDRHFRIKEWFDFYSDTLYYKLFSAWDVIGHVINVKYALGLKQKEVYFRSAVTALGKDTQEQTLYKGLVTITGSPHFERANGLRHDITHNYLPNVPSVAVHDDEKKSWHFGRKTTYVRSDEIVENVGHILRLFCSTLQYISYPRIARTP